LARSVELDQARRVAVGAEREIVLDEVEQELAVGLVAPGGEAVEGAVPCPLRAAVLLQHADKLRPQSVPADRNEVLASSRALGCGHERRHLAEACVPSALSRLGRAVLHGAGELRRTGGSQS